MKKLLGIGAALLLVAGVANANTIIINFANASDVNSIVAGVYNYDVSQQAWIGDMPTGADSLAIAVSGWEPMGWMSGSAPENWFGGDWNALKNTYGYNGYYSFNGFGADITGIPTAWVTAGATVDNWWGGYGPIGSWRGATMSTAGGEVHQGNFDNGGAFGAISFTTALDVLPVYGAGSGDPIVPEPGTIVLLGSLLGLGAIGGLRKRFFGAKKSVVA